MRRGLPTGTKHLHPVLYVISDTARISKSVNFFRASKSSVFRLLLTVLHLEMLLFSLCMLCYIAVVVASRLAVFTCIYCCVWGRRFRLSVKLKSSRFNGALYSIVCFPWDVRVSIILLTTRRKRKGKSMQTCQSLLFTCNGSASRLPSTTLQCCPSYELWMMTTIVLKKVTYDSPIQTVNQFLIVKDVYLYW